MRFVDEYRDPQKVMRLIETLNARANALPYTPQRPLRIMEVCGGHTHAIFQVRPGSAPAGEYRVYSRPRLPGVRPADGADRHLH